MNSRSISSTALSLATLSLVALASCGDDDTGTAATPAATTPATTAIAATTASASAAEALPGAVVMYTGAFDSPYCVTARDWVAHELQEFEPSEDPAVNRAYFVEYRTFIDKAAAQAPADIAADWTLFNAAQVKYEAILEHYNYDGARIEAEATDEEKAYLDTPPPAEQQAQENFHRYEAEVCHAGELLPAEVSYTGDANSEFCQLAEDPSNVTPPEELEEYFAGGAAARLADDRIAAAPPEIKADVEIEEGWKVEQTPILLAAHGWDFARVLREGTEEELLALTYAAPEVRDANARLGAYYEQVCEQ
jgi:hypothetical protein